MIDSFSVFWDKVGCRKRYWIPVLFFTISTFGFSIFSRTISIDDLRGDYYLGSHSMIAAGRWGMEIIPRIVAIPTVSPASDRLLATAVLMLASVLLAALFFHIHRDEGPAIFVEKYTLLSCGLITFPIIGEIWEYTGANYITTLGMLLSVFTCYYLLTLKQVRVGKILLCGAIMSLTTSGYESGAAFYVTLVCAILFYRHCVWGEERKKTEYWENAVLFATPMMLAILLRWIIASLLRWIMELPKGFSGEAVISWGNANIIDMLRRLYIETLLNYGINGLVYLPIGVFIIASIILFVFAIVRGAKKKNIMPLVGGGLLFLSVFSLTLIQGSIMFYRTAISLSVFTAFSLFCLAESFGHKSKWERKVAMILLFYVIWIQSSYLNSELALNNQRSENEMRTMSVVANRILSLNVDKPVVFIGQYDLGSYISATKIPDLDSFSGRLYEKLVDRLRIAYGDYFHFFTHFTSFPTTNVNSVINWALKANEMEDYLSYLGFDIQVVDMWAEKDIVAEAKEIAESTRMHSYSVMEAESFIIASLHLS